MGGWVEVHLAPLCLDLAGQHVDLDDALDIVAEELDADHVLAVRWLHLEDVATHPEARTGDRLGSLIGR